MKGMPTPACRIVRPFLFLLSCAALCPRSSTGAEVALRDEVVSIDWKRFDHPVEGNEDYRDCARILLNSAHYNLIWAPGGAERIENEWHDLTGRQAHDVIRPGCSASFGLAAVLKTGVFDEQAVGVSEAEAVARTVRLIKAVVAAHDGVGWKYPWQSAFWAAYVCQGGWMLWDELDGATQEQVAGIVEFEANRFIAPGYRVPYWNGRGGDTKAEENAWNTTILQLACAMMPAHPNAPQWKEVCSRLMISAYACQEDMQSDVVLDNRPVKDWLDGYNARDDGTVVNHGFIHPDYMCCILFNVRSHSTQSLAGQPVPEAADFRASSVYRAFVTHNWPSPPYKEPGGTIYVPGRAEVYFPQGTDWFDGMISLYYVMDSCADVLGWDADLPRPASHWMRLRGAEMLKRQARHEDRRHFAPGEFRGYPGREQQFIRLLADAFLFKWLDAHGAISPKKNWLDRP